MKIIIVEDEPVTSKIIYEVLKTEDYDVKEVKTGLEALKLLEQEEYHLVILDIVLPGMSGFEVCRRIRQQPVTYGDPMIMMLTSKTDVEDVAFGLDIGAEDYLRKPFEPLELVSRAKALLKRKESFKRKKGVYIYNDIIVDLNNSKVLENGQELILNKREMEVLAYFILNQGIVMERNKIYMDIWDIEYFEGNRTLDVCVARLKKKSKVFFEKLESVRGIGYKLK